MAVEVAFMIGLEGRGTFLKSGGGRKEVNSGCLKLQMALWSEEMMKKSSYEFFMSFNICLGLLHEGRPESLRGKIPYLSTKVFLSICWESFQHPSACSSFVCTFRF